MHEKKYIGIICIGIIMLFCMPTTTTRAEINVQNLYPIWVETWNNQTTSEARSICIINNSFYVTGLQKEDVLSISHLMVLKYNDNGQLIWNRSWGGTSDVRGFSSCTDGENLYVTGQLKPVPSDSGDIFIIKYNERGDLLWLRIWNNTDFDYAQDIYYYQSSIYITGYSVQLPPDASVDAIILKYDIDGNEIWNRTWGGPGEDLGYSLVAIGSNIYITGSTNSYGNGSLDGFLLQLDMSGNEIRNTTFGTMRSDEGRSIIADNSHLYITGISEDLSGNNDILFLKSELNGSHSFICNYNYGSDEEGRSIVLSSTDIYILGYSTNGGVTSIILIKLDTNNNVVWNKSWSRSASVEGTSLEISESNIYLVGLYYQASSPYTSLSMFMKLNLDGEGGPIVIEIPFNILAVWGISVCITIVHRLYKTKYNKIHIKSSQPSN